MANERRFNHGRNEKAMGGQMNLFDKAPNEMANATNIVWNRVVGASLPIDDDIFQNYAGRDVVAPFSHKNMPGILGIDVVNTIGKVDGKEHPINRAITRVYGQILAHTTGNLDLQQSEIAHFAIMGADIAASIATLLRVLSASNLWSNENWYRPHGVLKALGVEPSTVIGKQDELSTRINEVIRDYNSLMFPRIFDLEGRWVNQNGEIFLEEDSARSQMYFYRKTNYYTLEYDELTGEMLKSNAYPVPYIDGHSIDFSALIDIVQNQLDSVRASGWLGIVNSSLRRAYPDSSFANMDLVDKFYTVLPRAMPEQKWGIMNANVVEVDIESLDITVTPETGNITCKPKLIPDGQFSSQLALGFTQNTKRKWYSYQANPDATFDVLSSRFMVYAEYQTDGSIEVQYSGTEIITHIWGMQMINNGDLQLIDCGQGFFWLTGQIDQYARMYSNAINFLMQFDEAPPIYCIIQSESLDDDPDTGNVSYWFGPLRDVYNIAICDVATLQALSIACNTSIFTPLDTFDKGQKRM